MWAGPSVGGCPQTARSWGRPGTHWGKASAAAFPACKGRAGRSGRSQAGRRRPRKQGSPPADQHRLTGCHSDRSSWRNRPGPGALLSALWPRPPSPPPTPLAGCEAKAPGPRRARAVTPGCARPWHTRARLRLWRAASRGLGTRLGRPRQQAGRPGLAHPGEASSAWRTPGVSSGFTLVPSIYRAQASAQWADENPHVGS